MRAQRSARRLAALLVVGVATVEGACSLGLDPSLIGAATGDDGAAPGTDGGADAPGQADGDAHALTDAPLTVDAGACSKDSDCQSAAEAGAGCVTAATCDPTWHVCMLTTCATGACKSAVCNLAQQQCSVPVTYGFAAAHFGVSYGGVGGVNVRYSMAAAWPFVFVVTTNGVVAFNVVDPTNSSPPQVPVHGIPFIPWATIAVGRRVYFTGNTQGGGPTYRQAIAWVDVPQNPLLGSFEATSAFVGVTETGLANAVTNGVDGMFLVYGSGKLYPTANVRAPLDESVTLSTYSNAGLASGAGIAAASGSRLVAYRYDSSSYFPNLALVNGAATANAQTTTEQALSAYGPLANQSMMTTGDDGSLLWTTGVFAVDDAGSPTDVASARLTWLLGSGTAANFDTSAHVDLETYSPLTGSNVVGPPVWIDPSTALGLAAASSGSTDSTSVQLVKKSPPAVVAGTRTLLSIDPGSVGVAASGGFGYVLAQDDSNNKSCSVYIFAPACGGGGE